MCSCVTSDETSYHYMIECCNYDRLRADVVTKISHEFINLNTLLFGSPRYSYDYNVLIQKNAQEFFLGTARFS